MTTLCACGRPLHYNSPGVQAFIERLVEELGDNVVVTMGSQRFSVQRHYLALHGLRAIELPALAAEGVVTRLEIPAKG